MDITALNTAPASAGAAGNTWRNKITQQIIYTYVLLQIHGNEQPFQHGNKILKQKQQ